MYTEEVSRFPLQRYLHREGWIDTVVNQDLIFSHRNTWYTPDIFTEKFHAQEYYELVIYIQGDVEYLNENVLISPSPCMVTWFKPGQLHTTRLRSNSQYERYVLYFTPDFFDIGDKVQPILDFVNHSDGTYMTLSESKFAELLEFLKKVEAIIKKDKTYTELLLKAVFIEIFSLLDSQTPSIRNGEMTTESMAEIKRYIDENYATITSVSQIAEHFFYSREHLSRKFKEAFNMSLVNYLTRRKITESIILLDKMGVTEAAYAVGYRSQSAFIDAFKKCMHCLPSEYKAKNK